MYIEEKSITLIRIGIKPHQSKTNIPVIMQLNSKSTMESSRSLMRIVGKIKKCFDNQTVKQHMEIVSFPRIP